MTPAHARPKLKLGISSCLLGQKVRYDGGHKRDPFLTDILGPYVDWVPVCPEVEIGLGTPRPTIRLETDGERRPRLVMPSTGADLTKTMIDYAHSRLDQRDLHDLCGYVLKKNSPSCGTRRVEVHRENTAPKRNGIGAFADVLVRKWPELPVEEEGRLEDPRLRENFVSRVFAYRRWKDLAAAGHARQSLTDFHTAHAYQLMSHNEAGTRRLTRLLDARSSRSSMNRLAADYLDGFNDVMRRVPTRRSHAKVLHCAAGHVSEQLDRSDRAELARAIDEYRRGSVPLSVPIGLLRDWVRKLDVPHLQDQTYLRPHPRELGLLDHV
jgi:uncharacterized protein YbbK (DUF523 family)/uncharacterized protein YbgA (DUF1722 family)